MVDGEEKHARKVKKNDPVLLMSNDLQAITDWVSQVFRDASIKRQGSLLRPEARIHGVRRGVQHGDQPTGVMRWPKPGTPPPSFMIMRPSSQLKKMICGPAQLNALYPAQNLDGDIFSDISAALGGSLATASSMIESKDGTMLYEAPHGTAHDLYLRYLESDGKEAHFNSSALIYALANALETMAQREANKELAAYSSGLKQALIDTVAQGTITGDLKGKTLDPDSETIVDMCGFMDAVERNLNA